MKLQEIDSLINIRNYVANTIHNGYVDRSVTNAASRLLPFIDKKILGILQTEEFKIYVNYEDSAKKQ